MKNLGRIRTSRLSSTYTVANTWDSHFSSYSIPIPRPLRNPHWPSMTAAIHLLPSVELENYMNRFGHANSSVGAENIHTWGVSGIAWPSSPCIVGVAGVTIMLRTLCVGCIALIQEDILTVNIRTIIFEIRGTNRLFFGAIRFANSDSDFGIGSLTT